MELIVFNRWYVSSIWDCPVHIYCPVLSRCFAEVEIVTNKLPTELIITIVERVEKVDLKTCRLMCKFFESLTFPLLFDDLRR